MCSPNKCIFNAKDVIATCKNKECTCKAGQKTVSLVSFRITFIGSPLLRFCTFLIVVSLILLSKTRFVEAVGHQSACTRLT